MEKIKKIEILDRKKNWPEVLIDLADILEPIGDGSQLCWAVLDFYAFDYPGVAQPIAHRLASDINQEKIIRVSWKEIQILAEGVGQFIDFVLIGSKDLKKLRCYEDDDEMLQECDIVIIAFDGCWWEVSCKDEALMKKYLDTFKEIRVVYLNDENN